MKKILGRLNYANVMATVAVFMALGGGAYAAKVQLGKNAVKTKSIKNGAVTESKLASNAVTEKKIKPFDYAAVSGFANGWTAVGGLQTPQSGKDALGIVHLRGYVGNGSDNTTAFTLPSDQRPVALATFAVIGSLGNPCEVSVNTTGAVVPFGCGAVPISVSLDGINYPAGR